MKKRAFVLMPFDDEFNEIYSSFIQKILTEIGFEVFRADDLLSSQNILRDIISYIESSDLIIADLTGANPNVFYELGIAHTLKKNVIMLIQDIQELPFDLRSYRVVTYDTHFAKLPKAMQILEEMAEQAHANSLPFGSPIQDFISLNFKSDEDKVEETEESGFLDNIVGIEENFSRLTDITGQITKYIELVGNQASELGNKIQKVNQNPSQGTARYLQKLLKREGTKLNKWASDFSNLNDEYVSILNAANTHIEFAIKSPVINHNFEEKDVQEFFTSLFNIEEAVKTSRGQLLGLIDSMDGVINIEKVYNRAKNAMAEEIRRLINHLDRTIAMVSRARNIKEEIEHNNGGA